MVNDRVNDVANHMVNHNSAYPTILSFVLSKAGSHHFSAPLGRKFITSKLFPDRPGGLMGCPREVKGGLAISNLAVRFNCALRKTA
jgi:hypothetical protein